MKKTNSAIFRMLCPVLACALPLMAASGCSKKNADAEAAEPSKPIAVAAEAAAAKDQAAGDQVKHQVMAFDLEGLADDGSKKWDVKGQSAEAVTDSQVKLNNITASSYGKEAQATITADSGLYDRTKNNVRLEQNVKAVIENKKGGGQDLISIPSAESVTARPEGSAAPDATDPARKTKTVITCDAEVEFNYEKNEAYFNRNVHVVNEDGTIDADRITIYLDQATKTVKTIVAEGNVKIQRGENITYSEKATYVEADKKIVLSGRPKLVIYQEGQGSGGEIFAFPK